MALTLLRGGLTWSGVRRTGAAGAKAVALVVATAAMVSFLVSSGTVLSADTSAAGVSRALIGKAHYQCGLLEEEIREVLADDSPTADRVPMVARLLARHLQVAKDLVTAYALAGSASESTVEPAGAVPDQGFFFAALNRHRTINDRLFKILETAAPFMTEEVRQGLKAGLDEALRLAPYGRRRRARQVY